MSVHRPDGTQCDEIPYHRQPIQPGEVLCVVTDADRRYLIANRDRIRDGRQMAKARYLADCAMRYAAAKCDPANLPHAYCGG